MWVIVQVPDYCAAKARNADTIDAVVKLTSWFAQSIASNVLNDLCEGIQENGD
jgi:hypothetical protein